MKNEKRLIDADALIERLMFKRKISLQVRDCKYRGLESAIAQCKKAPTIDAVEVVHGRWISHEGYEECNVCHTKAMYEHNYCPNCGAKMDGDENGPAQK